MSKIRKTKKVIQREVIVVLPDIRSAHNVGSIFRTSDGAGVSRIILSGYSPRPMDKFGRTQRDIAKTALGAEMSVSWTYEKSLSTVLKRLRAEKFEIVAVEQSKKSVLYSSYKPPSRVVFIFGNEVGGIPTSVLKKCDVVLEITMKGKKESLNVAAAAAVVLFRVLGV